MQWQQHGGTGCHLPGGARQNFVLHSKAILFLVSYGGKKKGGALPREVMHTLTRNKGGFFVWL